MIRKYFSIGLSILTWLLFQHTREKQIKIYLAGDSTMAAYEPARLPLNGWGMPFATFFDSAVIVENKARGGRSTRTFISEGRWKAIADSLNPGDYVLIQFGHNDEAKEEKYKDRYTPIADYKSNLEKFITESRAKHAHPVIITPVSRMKFDNDGHAMETHTEYTAAAILVAKTHHVPLIDLDASSRALYQDMGPTATKYLFMQLDSMQHPNYPAGQKDNTHFSEYGARRVAELVLAGIRSELPSLAEHIVKSKRKK